MVLGVVTISEFCRKYKLNEKAKTELITMQAFHQGVAMIVGGGAVLILQIVLRYLGVL